MPHNYDTIDLRWTWNGDYAIDTKGDLKDTVEDGLLSLKQELHTIAASELGDWEVYPGLGATLSDYVGEPNSRETANAINDRLRVAITTAGIVLEEDLDIKVVPIHRHRVLVIIRVNAMSTANNDLENNRLAVTALLFDFLEHGIWVLDKVPELI